MRCVGVSFSQEEKAGWIKWEVYLKKKVLVLNPTEPHREAVPTKHKEIVEK